MSRIKTIICTALLLTGTPLMAGGNLHLIFAECAGRHAAEVEHAYLLGREASLHAEQRLTFASLVEATLPAGEGPQTLHHRIAAKMAQARLLTLADFAHDAERAEAARRASTGYITSCSRLLLES